MSDIAALIGVWAEPIAVTVCPVGSTVADALAPSSRRSEVWYYAPRRAKPVAADVRAVSWYRCGEGWGE